jgi:hypothetical protein
MKEAAKHRTKWIIHKFRDPDGIVTKLLKKGTSINEVTRLYPDRFIDEERFEGNCLLNEGIQYFEDILAGIVGSPTLWDNTNARVGVGNSATGEDPVQTDLQGASKTYAGMDATYPSRSSQALSWRGTFGDGFAEYAWEEFVVDNGAVSGKTLNRKVTSKGTKGAGEAWTLTVEITFS